MFFNGKKAYNSAVTLSVVHGRIGIFVWGMVPVQFPPPNECITVVRSVAEANSEGLGISGGGGPNDFERIFRLSL